MKLHFLLLVVLSLVQFSCQAQDRPKSNTSDVAVLLKKEPGIVIDVRTLEEWNSGHYSKAIHFDWTNGDFEKASASWDKNKRYYLYCAAGGRSAEATEFLKKSGFKNVTNLGGYDRLKSLK